jgi:peptide/nickel transport system substrate-binding protein
MKKSLGLISLCMAMALVMSACGSTTSGGGTEGGTLRVGTASGIDSMNPFVAFQQDAYATFEYIYPMLVQYDTRTLQFQGDFATDWETSSDKLTWTFHTRPNSKWSDGEPLTAEDVAWTFNTILKYGDGPTANWIGTLAHVDKVEATDDNTLEISYKDPVGNVLSNLQQIPILPQHVWEKYATGDGKELKTTPNTPEAGKSLVSGGAFTLTEYKKDDIALFEKNPNYYGPEPHIDGWGLKFFSNDDAMLTALKNGEVDAVEGVPATNIKGLRDADFEVFVGPALEFRDFIINSNPKKPEHRELLDFDVKKAFEYAIDRERIVQTAWLGYASVGTTIVPPGTGKWHNDSIQPLPFDLDKANELLDKAGLKKGSDGIRVAGDHKMEYDVIFPHDEQGEGDRVFQIIQSDFEKIGVKLNQRPMDDSAAFEAIGAPDYKYLDFDLAMWDWVPLEDPDFILSVLNCNQFGGWNDSGYCNPKYDKLYHEQGLATDPGQRLKIVYEMQKLAYDERPYIVMTYDKIIDSWSKDWTDFVESNQSFFNPLSKESLTEVHRTG